MVLDLVLNAAEELRKIPQTSWYRLQRLAEPVPTAFLVLTRHSIMRLTRPALAAALAAALSLSAASCGSDKTTAPLDPNAVAYSVSKAGVIALTKSLGKELAGYDIAVNAITPAAAKTAIFDQMSEEHIGYMLSKIPRARFVKVEEIAALAAWCASQDNSFTTGAVFDISGGRATY